MQLLEVGQPYPHPNPMPGPERVVLQRTEAFFDVLYFSPQAQADAPVWRTGALRVGVAEPAPGVASVLFELPNGWEFDVSLNLHKANTPEQAQAWLQSTARTMTLCLIDSRTNRLRGLRLVSMEEEQARALRAVASRQLERFPDAPSVDRAIAGQDSISLTLLLRQTRMRPVGR